MRRSQGKNPDVAELKRMISEVDTANSGTIDFPEFLKLMAQKMKEADLEEELTEAFKVLDEDKDGYISAAELRRVLTNNGKKLSEKQVDKMLREVGMHSYDEKIDYKKLVQIMIPK